MTIIRQPDAKTSAAASGSAQMLNSAEAVMLPPSLRAPPMTTTGPRWPANLGSARIAISDVALKGASLDEVQAVTGHEIGHYVLGHIWRIVAIMSVLAMLFFFLADRLFPAFSRLFGSRIPISEPASFPVLYFFSGIFMLLAQPILNADSRADETAADRYSLETVNLPDALSSALVKTAEYRYPRPSRLQELLFYTHPSVENRVLAAMEWKAAHPPVDTEPAPVADETPPPAPAH